jgi:hypothetical protein
VSGARLLIAPSWKSSPDLAEYKLNLNRGIDGDWLAIPHSGSEAVLTGRINGLLIATKVKGATMRISRGMSAVSTRALVRSSAGQDRSADGISYRIVAISSLDGIQHFWCLSVGSLNGLLGQLAAGREVNFWLGFPASSSAVIFIPA